jgi:iron complex outermembrane receptor protein
MLYFSAATGYRQGTFNSPSGSSPSQFSILEPETNLAFEIGAKTTWLDNRLQLNAAVFDYDYTNMQVFALQQIAGEGAPQNIESNAGKSFERGGELSLKASPSNAWLITAEVGYVDAKFTEFNTVTNTGMPISLAGNRLPRAPQWTAGTMLQYHASLGSGGSVVLQTDWNYRSDYYVNPDNLNNPYIPGRTIGNVRATYVSPSDHWEFGLWAQNVTDKKYPMGGYSLAFANSKILYFGDPLTYGATISLKY